MAERKRVYLPPFLTAANFAQSARYFGGLAEISPKEFLSPLAKPREVLHSLARFVDDVQTSGQLAKLIEEESKSGQFSKNDREVSLFYYSGKCQPKEKPYRFFYFDTPYSLMLFLGDPLLGNGACIGFNIFRDSSELDNARVPYHGRGMNIQALSVGDLIIEQLQGPTYADHKSKMKILPQFRWEVVLVGLVVKWAKSVGFPRVFMLPGEFNNYYERSKPDERGWLLRRYNGTAARCGFRRIQKDGPYVLDFRSKFAGLIDGLFLKD